MGRFEEVIVVASQIRPAEVIRENEKNIRRLIGAGQCCGEAESGEGNDETLTSFTTALEGGKRKT